MAHGYPVCKALFLHKDLIIPPVQDFGLPLARLSNGKQHEQARSAAMEWYNQIKKVDTGKLLETLIPEGDGFDFVAAVSKQLPLLRILQGLNFNEEYSAWVIKNIPTLVKIMAPEKSAEEVEHIRQLIKEFKGMNDQEGLFTGNLLGLFIQSHDAGRGLLTNAVLRLADSAQGIDLKRMITEVLRIDPPIHLTRRIAAKDILINQQHIKSGNEILLIMASANLDGSVFENPCEFNLERSNNEEHLSFGAGAHACLAKYLAVDMAVDAVTYLRDYYHLEIPEQEFSYEPQLNARLHRKLIVNLKRIKS